MAVPRGPRDQHYVSELRISHLRSFRQETAIPLRKGLNLIVGANGSGKSNAIDAALFGLVQEPSLLRVRTWAELCNRDHRGPCAVRVTIKGRESEDPRTVIVAHVKEQDASRVFKIDGRSATGTQVRDALLECGLDTSIPSFVVRQHAAAQPMNNATVTALLQQASGASRWHAAAAHSQSQLAKERKNLQLVHSNIRDIEALLEQERAAHAALCKMVSLRRRRRQGCERMASLAACLSSSSQAQSAARLDSTRKEIAAIEQDTSNAQEQSKGLQQAHEKALEQARDDSEKLLSAMDDVRRSTEATMETEAELVHAAVMLAQSSYQQANISDERGQSEQAEVEQSRALGRLEGLLKAARHDRARAQQAMGEAQAAYNRVQAATNGGWLVEGALSSLQLQTEARLATLESDHIEALSAAADATSRVHVILAERKRRTKELEAVTVSLEDTKEARRQNERRALEMQARAAKTGMRDGDFDADIRAAENAVAEAEGRRHQAAMQLQQGDCHSTKYPTLASKIRLKLEDPRLRRCLVALDVLAGKHLSVRLTPSAEAAIPLLQAARAQGKSIRVWPMQSLSVTDRSEEHVALQQHYGDDKVILPTELVESFPLEAGDCINFAKCSPCSTWPALLAAFGQCLIVLSDDLASELVQKHRVRCITIEGNIHEPGKLQGGYRDQGQRKPFEVLLAHQRAISDVERARKVLDDLSQQREWLRSAESATTASRTAAAAEADASSRLAQLRRSLDSEQAELQSEILGAAQHEALAASSAAHRAAWQKDLRAIGECLVAAGEEGGLQASKTALKQFVAQRSRRELELRQRVEQLERDVAQHDVDASNAYSLELEERTIMDQREEQQAIFTQSTHELCRQEVELDQRLAIALEMQKKATRSSLQATSLSGKADQLARNLQSKKSQREALQEELKHLETHAADDDLPDIVQRWLCNDASAPTGSSNDAPDDGDDVCEASSASDDDEEEVSGLTDAELRELGMNARIPATASGDYNHAAGGVDVDYRASPLRDGSAVDKHSITSRLEDGELLLETWRQMQCELQEKHGTSQMLKAMLAERSMPHAGLNLVKHSSGTAADAPNPVNRLGLLQLLHRKAATVLESINKLNTGIEEMKEQVAEANREAVAFVGSVTKETFETLVPSMEMTLECADAAALEECGARVGVRSRAVGSSADTRAAEWRYGLTELSGGQRTLLNLSLLLAIARYRPSMILLMDEVDAALDETNAARVAELLKTLSTRSQIVAISHRPELHRVADHIVRLHKEKDYTAVRS